MNGLVPASWDTVLCTQDGKYNPLGKHQLRREPTQLLLRHDPKAAKFVGQAISAFRKDQQWKIK